MLVLSSTKVSSNYFSVLGGNKRNIRLQSQAAVVIHSNYLRERAGSGDSVVTVELSYYLRLLRVLGSIPKDLAVFLKAVLLYLLPIWWRYMVVVDLKRCS